jgi:hypothetical protein
VEDNQAMGHAVWLLLLCVQVVMAVTAALFAGRLAGVVMGCEC